MQLLESVHENCNPYGQVNAGGIVTTLALPNGDCNPKAFSLLAGVYLYTPRLVIIFCMLVSL